MKLVLTPIEAADALCISRAHLYRLLADGTIPSFVLGKKRLIRTQALLDYVEQLERSQAARRAQQPSPVVRPAFSE